MDYDIVQSTEQHKAVVRVNIFKNNRQTIQYFAPGDAHVLGQAELVIVDEAAAIPLPTVRAMLGSHLMFMASTIHGYEGTGRALSLKLLQQLRQQSAAQQNAAKEEDTTKTVTPSLREITLETPIRYAKGDPIEAWLNKLLCLDSADHLTRQAGVASNCPHPSSCGLFAIDRDTLFSYHHVSEIFLQRIMALYVASHYKNSPNDLQLMSDAPGHHLFVLLPPVKAGELPEPLVVVQLALEGAISRKSIADSLRRGKAPAGDMMPWTMSQQVLASFLFYRWPCIETRTSFKMKTLGLFPVRGSSGSLPIPTTLAWGMAREQWIC